MIGDQDSAVCIYEGGYSRVFSSSSSTAGVWLIVWLLVGWLFRELQKVGEKGVFRFLLV